MRLAVTVVWVAFVAGCIESNPQPSPGTKDALVGGTDSVLAESDSVSDFGGLEDLKTEDQSLPSDVMLDVGADLVDVAADMVDVADIEVTEIPAGCCELGSVCEEGKKCVEVAPGEKWGKCLPAPELGQCWTMSECDLNQGEYCDGAMVQSCLSVLAVMDTVGHCVHDDPPLCCGGDEQCLPGMVCVGFGGDGGTCEPAPAVGECWDDGDCYGTQTCEGAKTCGCMGACAWLPMPGKCTPLPLGCCNSDVDCGLGEVCRAKPSEGGQMPGSCVPDPLGPQCMGDSACCWEDSDCPGPSTCKGASVCGCIDLCVMCSACAPNQMGFCG